MGTVRPRHGRIVVGLTLACAWASTFAMPPEVGRPGESSAVLSPADASGSTAGGFSSFQVNLLSHVPLQDFPGGSGSGNDVWGYVSPSGREYAIIGLSSGTGFVDVTDPTQPVVIADIPDATSTWSDMAVFGEYAYNVNEADGGMQIIDLTQIDQGIVQLAGALTSNGFDTAHNVYVNPDSGYAYLCGANSPSFGLVAVDVSDPANPVMVGIWTDHYAHDVYVHSYSDCPTSTRSGPCEIAFVFGAGAGFSIVDVTDKSTMTTLSHMVYPTLDVSHQGWITEDERFVIMGDEGDETSFGLPTTTYVVDVQDLDAPFIRTTFTNGVAAIDHNLMVRGDYVFEANYHSGLRIFDISDIDNAAEVGFFDTYPPNDSPGFSGAWGVYTQLPSGIVLVSDRSGLFVLDAEPAVGCQQDSHCNDGNGCTIDTCDAGACQHTTLSEGSACDDGDICTFGGTCDAGGNCITQNYNDVPCTDDGPCGPGTCDLDSGFCVCLPCGAVEPPLEDPTVVPQNRYLSVVPANPGKSTALRVRVLDMPSPLEDLIGTDFWVGAPQTLCENSGQVAPGEGGCSAVPGLPTSFKAAPLDAEPFFLDWGSEGRIEVFAPAIVPGGAYAVQAISLGCFSGGVMNFSIPVDASNAGWGDIVGDCATSPCSAPEGSVNVRDVLALLDKFANLPGAVRKSRGDLGPAGLDHLIGVTDVVLVLNAFAGEPFPYAGS